MEHPFGYEPNEEDFLPNEEGIGKPFEYTPEPEPDPDRDNPSSPDYEPKNRQVVVVNRIITIQETLLVERYPDDQSVTAEEIVANNKSVLLDRQEKFGYQRIADFTVGKELDIFKRLTGGVLS